jgi:hypothetical protein
MPRLDDPGGWRSSIECLWRQNDNSEAIIHSPVKRERISILPPSLEQLLKVQTELAAIGGLEAKRLFVDRLPPSTSRSPRPMQMRQRARRRASARLTMTWSWHSDSGLATRRRSCKRIADFGQRGTFVLRRDLDDSRRSGWPARRHYPPFLIVIGVENGLSQPRWIGKA